MDVPVFIHLFILFNVILIVNVIRWNCTERAKKLLILQNIMFVTTGTCLVISSIEFIQYLMFKTCWISFMFLDMSETTPKIKGLSR